MKDGDYYRWRYINPPDKQSPYWCKSCIGFVKDGRFYDIFWLYIDEKGMINNVSGDATRWPVDKLDHLSLTFMANQDDLIRTSTPEYYADKDIVKLSHPNQTDAGSYHIKGAKKSRAVMRGLLEDKERELISSIKWSEGQLSKVRDNLADIDKLDLDKLYI